MLVSIGIALMTLLVIFLLKVENLSSHSVSAHSGNYYGKNHVNPFMGFAPPADGGPYAQPHSLVHANFSWRELEPEKGVYNFEKLEKKYKLNYWRQQDIKLIFRVVLDLPAPVRQKDIPDWLYAEINEDGTWYDHEWGMGFSPNYYNRKLINYHESLIQALAARYNDDPSVAFIQLGSLGHWGEWHTLQQDGIYIPFPKLHIAETYVTHYINQFPDKKLMMRRPHPIAADHHMGLYNDMFGKERDTMGEFWNWVENGYQFWLTKEEFPPMKGFWLSGPSGGEFAPVQRWEEYFSSSAFPKTVQQLERTHVSWLGPSSPASYPAGGEHQSELDLFLGKMGYQFRIGKITHPEKVEQSQLFEVKMKVENEGVAPFYYHWPVELTFSNDQGKIVYTHPAETDIREWGPGKHRIIEKVRLPSDMETGKYQINIAILDPDKKEPAIRFNMDGERPDGRYTIGEITIGQSRTGQLKQRVPY